MKYQIPVLGIPIVNGYKWIERLINSIDFPIKHVIIIDNSGGKDKTFVKNLDLLVENGSSFVESMKVCHLPSNIGVAGAWNLIIKSYLMESSWIIANHDIAFAPGLLEEIFETAKDSEIGMIHPSGGDFNLGSYDLFMIKDWVVQKIGLFDENYYPAYGEDADYIMRLRNDPVKSKIGLSKIHLHGDDTAKPGTENYKKEGRQTAKEGGKVLSMRLDCINDINFEYSFKKWGEGWRWCSPYKTPMNNSELPLSYTTYDLSFVRMKYLDF